MNANIYQHMWSSLRTMCAQQNTKNKVVHLLPKFLRKSGNFCSDEDGCLMIRNDVLARAFATGTPYKLKERPECASFVPSKRKR